MTDTFIQPSEPIKLQHSLPICLATQSQTEICVENENKKADGNHFKAAQKLLTLKASHKESINWMYLCMYVWMDGSLQLVFSV